jgi:hypothetical protein
MLHELALRCIYSHHHSPTRIRQNIRDQITSKDAPLTATTSKLSTLLGYPISFDPEWGMLWTTLHSYYPDQATFIPNVASVITTWCHAFTTWIEDDSNEEAVERLLDALKGYGSLKLALEVLPLHHHSAPKPCQYHAKSHDRINR